MKKSPIFVVRAGVSPLVASLGERHTDGQGQPAKHAKDANGTDRTRTCTDAHGATRQVICEGCEHFVAAGTMAVGVELRMEGLSAEVRLCGHPKCGCWRNRQRLEPWKRRICPERKW